ADTTSVRRSISRHDFSSIYAVTRQRQNGLAIRWRSWQRKRSRLLRQHEKSSGCLNERKVPNWRSTGYSSSRAAPKAFGVGREFNSPPWHSGNVAQLSKLRFVSSQVGNLRHLLFGLGNVGREIFLVSAQGGHKTNPISL